MTKQSMVLSEAIRKPFHTVAARSRSLFAVMKRRATAGRGSVQHKMYMTDLDHCSTRFCTAFIVFTVPSIPTMPGIGAFNHPTFRQRCEAPCARWTCFHLDVPGRTMLGHPGIQVMVVILLICKDREETWKLLRRDAPQQDGGCYPIIETGTGDEDDDQ